MSATAYVVLWVAAIPLIYYLLVLYSAAQFFRAPLEANAPKSALTLPVSILKPLRGLDPEAYENLASFCRQDYPDYEIVFCADRNDTLVLPVIDKLIHDFPERRIRVLFGSGRDASNDKVAKLARLVNEADHEVVVISDSDVRVRPDYLRTVTAPLRDPQVGAVTCFYIPTDAKTFVDNLQSIGMLSDFYAGILVAWKLDGVKFALGPTIVTTRARLAGFGGYEAIENRPADDLLVGRLIAAQGYTVKLLRYAVATVADYKSMGDLLHKRMRWTVVMRHMRPWGHFGLLLTQGLPWSLAAIAVRPSMALAYLGTYIGLRICMTWLIGIRGLRQHGVWRRMFLIPVWDAVAFFIWLTSFARKSVRWRGSDYYLRDGELVATTASDK